MYAIKTRSQTKLPISYTDRVKSINLKPISLSSYNSANKYNTAEKLLYRKMSRKFAKLAEPNLSKHVRMIIDDDQFHQIQDDIAHGFIVKMVKLAQFDNIHYKSQINHSDKINKIQPISLHYGPMSDRLQVPFRADSIDFDAMGTVQGNKCKNLSPINDIQSVLKNNNKDVFSIVMNNADHRGQGCPVISPETTNLQLEKIFDNMGFDIIRKEIWKKPYGRHRMRPRAYLLKRRIIAIDTH